MRAPCYNFFSPTDVQICSALPLDNITRAFSRGVYCCEPATWGKAGCRFLRKVLDKHDEAGQLRVNFVQSIMEFEDRFMAEEDKNFLLRILKSLARGNLVQV